MTQSKPPVRRLLTAEDVADLLQVKATWVYAAARQNRIPHIKVGRYRRFDAEQIEAWWNSRKAGPWREVSS